MLRVTQWRPDTCRCVLSYEWDDAKAEDDREHKALPPEFKCLLHEGISDPQAHLEVVLEHNRTANV